MLVMNVVITCTVEDAESTVDVLETVDVVHGCLEVAFAVILKGLHVALGVHGIVEAPVRHRCCDEAEAKYSGVGLDGLGCEVSAVRPAPHADLLRVYVVEPLDELLGSPDLIQRLKFSELRGHKRAVLSAAHGSTTVIDGVDNVLQLRVGRDGVTVWVLQLKVGDVGQAVLRDVLVKLLVIDQGAHRLAGRVDGVELLVGNIRTLVVQDVVAAVGRERGTPRSRDRVIHQRSELLRLPRHLVDVSLGGVRLGGLKVDKLLGGVDVQDGGDLPLA
ncbi:hypothetical protein HG530_011865 [Fusarium avenaceum]|nr:hypothetical protein HG530_011865 [Fusarium avenaceum]